MTIPLIGNDTIAALASAPGPAARGIIRIAGDNVRDVVEAGFETSPDAAPQTKSCSIKPQSSKPDDRVAGSRDSSTTSQTLRGPRRFPGRWQLADESIRIPCDLLIWPGRRSYTGQPTAELHLPGSPPLLERVLEDLFRRGVRPARPGEFTLRAFLAGKIDLLQAEAVLGVIDAHSDAELRVALQQLAGGISARLARLRTDLLELLADLEAGLDFVEEDIEFVTRGEILSRIAAARHFVETLQLQAESRMTSSALPKVVLAGLPNAGKSSLFNALAGRPAALVSPREGTTRDYLQETLDGDGVRFELIDTAGWEASTDGISGAAQLHRADQFERAALIVWCSASDDDRARRQADEDALSRAVGPVLRVWTKCDLPHLPPDIAVHNIDPPYQGVRAHCLEEIMISVHAGIGLDDLRDEIIRRLSAPSSRSASWLGMTAARCRETLQHAAAALARAEEAAGLSAVGDELLAIDLRDALDHLGQIVGAVYTDDLLDRVFSKFCIGK